MHYLFNIESIPMPAGLHAEPWICDFFQAVYTFLGDKLTEKLRKSAAKSVDEGTLSEEAAAVYTTCTLNFHELVRQEYDVMVANAEVMPECSADFFGAKSGDAIKGRAGYKAEVPTPYRRGGYKPKVRTP